MKNLLCLLTLLFVLSCSNDEMFSEKELKTPLVELDSKSNSKKITELKSPCTNPLFINESFVPASIPYSIDINWHNTFIMLDCNAMEGKIEVSSVQCNEGINITTSVCIPVDFFNTTSYTLTIPDFGTKCLWWRIVLEGKDCTKLNSNCETATPWHFASTYNL